MTFLHTNVFFLLYTCHRHGKSMKVSKSCLVKKTFCRSAIVDPTKFISKVLLILCPCNRDVKTLYSQGHIKSLFEYSRTRSANVQLDMLLSIRFIATRTTTQSFFCSVQGDSASLSGVIPLIRLFAVICVYYHYYNRQPKCNRTFLLHSLYLYTAHIFHIHFEG